MGNHPAARGVGLAYVEGANPRESLFGEALVPHLHGSSHAAHEVVEVWWLVASSGTALEADDWNLYLHFPAFRAAYDER